MKRRKHTLDKDWVEELKATIYFILLMVVMYANLWVWA